MRGEVKRAAPLHRYPLKLVIVSASSLSGFAGSRWQPSLLFPPFRHEGDEGDEGAEGRRRLATAWII
jgi:hypothetical protein